MMIADEAAQKPTADRTAGTRLSTVALHADAVAMLKLTRPQRRPFVNSERTSVDSMHFPHAASVFRDTCKFWPDRVRNCQTSSRTWQSGPSGEHTRRVRG
eukprot:4478659-Prymnesium_polylepis.1